jgi:hypothetical protein
MKPIKAGELFGHVSRFLEAKGIELKQGAYTTRIEKGCSLLSSAINASQKSLKVAKTEAARKLDEMRQVIHEKTAPPAPVAGPSNPKKKAAATGGQRRATKASRQRTGSKSRRSA